MRLRRNTIRYKLLLAVTGLVLLVSKETTKDVWSNVNLGLRSVASNPEGILPVQIAFGRHWWSRGVNKINVVGKSGLMYVARKWEPIVYTSDDDRENRWFSVPVRVRPSFIGFVHFLLTNANNAIAPQIVAGKQSSKFPRIGTIFSFLVAPSYFFVDDILNHSLAPVFWNHLCVETNVGDDGMSDVDQPVVHQDRETSVWVVGQVTPSFNISDFYPSSFASEQGIGAAFSSISRLLVGNVHPDSGNGVNEEHKRCNSRKNYARSIVKFGFSPALLYAPPAFEEEHANRDHPIIKLIIGISFCWIGSFLFVLMLLYDCLTWKRLMACCGLFIFGAFIIQNGFQYLLA